MGKRQESETLDYCRAKIRLLVKAYNRKGFERDFGRPIEAASNDLIEKAAVEYYDLLDTTNNRNTASLAKAAICAALEKGEQDALP